MGKITVIVDYSMPTMKAERALKRLHDHMLDKQYDKAAEQALIALAETKLALNAIRHQQEQEG